MNDTPQEIFSIIGMNYLLPISKCLEMIMKEKRIPPIDLETIYDNGYSVGVVVLTVLMIESFIRKACLILNHDPDKKVLEYFKNEFSDYSRRECIEEVFVLRDVIAHNHLWSMNPSWNLNGIMTIHDVDLISLGDKKYRRVKDPNTSRSNKLKMRLRPTNVCFEEAFIVLHEANYFFEYLEKKDKKIMLMDSMIIQYNDKVYKFREFIKEVPLLAEATIISSV